MRVMIVNALKARNRNFRKGFWRYDGDGEWMDVTVNIRKEKIYISTLTMSCYNRKK
jgi:hypothetical protein